MGLESQLLRDVQLELIDVPFVGLSLKKKGNLVNKLTSNPTELWVKGLENMLYLMNLGNLIYI